MRRIASAAELAGSTLASGAAAGQVLPGGVGAGGEGLVGDPAAAAAAAGSPAEPLSTFYEWSCEYFARPQTRPVEEDETSPGYVDRVWRAQRAAQLEKEAQVLRDAAVRKLEAQIALLDNVNETATRMLFHAYDPVLVVADEQEAISVWNWEAGQRMNCFSNRAAAGERSGRVTSMHLLNEAHISPLLLSGADSGVVRVWRGIYQQDQLELVTSWRALSDLMLSTRTRGAGLVLDWLPESAQLLATGDVEVVRIWDLERELYIQNIATHSDQCVACLAHEHQGRLICAGFGDGTIRLFDARTPARYSCVQTLAEHSAWVLTVAMPRGSPGLVVSGSVAGDVKFWDLRKAAASSSSSLSLSSSVPSLPASASACINTVQNAGGLATLAVHPWAPVIACGLLNQKIRVVNFNGDDISMIRYHDGSFHLSTYPLLDVLLFREQEKRERENQCPFTS
jgi:regulator-associated protein of mTOR